MSRTPSAVIAGPLTNVSRQTAIAAAAERAIGQERLMDRVPRGGHWSEAQPSVDDDAAAHAGAESKIKHRARIAAMAENESRVSRCARH